jgi:hypothetical protein
MAQHPWPQSTVEEIADSEARMVHSAPERFGDEYRVAWMTSILLSKCVVSIDHTRMHFGRFLALTKKHHSLAVLSIVRLHKVQAMMNLRQSLEAGCAAAFAIANPEDEHFFKLDEKGVVKSPQKLTDKRYRWLERNFNSKSDVIKAKKNLINDNHSHTNIVSSGSIFRLDDTGELANSPFFDIEDNHLVKCDLWLASTIALELADWFYGVNKGVNMIEFMPGFIETVQSLGAETDALRVKMIETDRYKAAMVKWGGPQTAE